MAHHAISRRALLGTALIASLGLRATGAAAEGAEPLRFRAVAVDVAPLIEHGGSAVAARLSAALLPEMRTVFADRLSPADRRAPLLTARITNLFMADYVERGTDFAFGNNDNIEGDGIVSSGGAVLTTTHVLTELPPSYSGPPLQPGVDAARLQAIAYQFAYWLHREMAG